MNNYYVYMNGMFCLAISLRILTYQRGNARYQFVPSFIAYLMAVATGTIGLASLTGHNLPEAEVVLNGIICAAVFTAGGNIRRLFSKRNRKDET